MYIERAPGETARRGKKVVQSIAPQAQLWYRIAHSCTDSQSSCLPVSKK